MVGAIIAACGRPMFEHPVASDHRPDRPLDSRQSLRLVDTRTFEGSGNFLHRYSVETDEA